jgi:hypothetical protein
MEHFEIAQMLHEERLRRAERRRLCRQIGPNKPPRRARLVSAVRDLLVTLGDQRNRGPAVPAEVANSGSRRELKIAQ